MLADGFVTLEAFNGFLAENIEGDVLTTLAGHGELVFFPDGGNADPGPHERVRYTSHYWLSPKLSVKHGVGIVFSSHGRHITPFTPKKSGYTQSIPGRLFYLKRHHRDPMSLDHIYRHCGLIELSIGDMVDTSWEDLLDKLHTQTTVTYAEMYLVCNVTGEESLYRQYVVKDRPLPDAEKLKAEIKTLFHDLFRIRSFKVATLTRTLEEKSIIDEDV